MRTVSAGLASTLLVLVLMPACSSGGEPATCEPSGTELQIAVETTHRFTTGCLASPADQAFTIHFVNDDPSGHGIHNVSIRDAQNDVLFEDDLIRGGEQITYEVGPLAAGTYEFFCTNHPEMKGRLIVG